MKTLCVENRRRWRSWLEKNHESVKEIWLVYYKKATGKVSIPYGDSVEEAICFGWIDSLIRKIDDKRYARKFNPRRDKSVWSNLNKERAMKMIREGKMIAAGLTAVEAAKDSGEWDKDGRSERTLAVPSDLEEAFASNIKAKSNFENMAPSYRKLYIAWINDAKRDETRKKRILKTVAMVEGNRKPGMM